MNHYLSSSLPNFLLLKTLQPGQCDSVPLCQIWTVEDLRSKPGRERPNENLTCGFELEQLLLHLQLEGQLEHLLLYQAVEHLDGQAQQLRGEPGVTI